MSPSLFVVGAMKGGTTTLDTHLEAHPRIFMSDPREASYFADQGSKLLAAWSRQPVNH